MALEELQACTYLLDQGEPAFDNALLVCLYKGQNACLPCETRENRAGRTTMQVVLALRVRLGLIGVGISRSYNRRKTRQPTTEVEEDLKKGWPQDTDDDEKLPRQRRTAAIDDLSQDRLTSFTSSF